MQQKAYNPYAILREGFNRKKRSGPFGQREGRKQRFLFLSCLCLYFTPANLIIPLFNFVTNLGCDVIHDVIHD
jgi:hypothetical protein